MKTFMECPAESAGGGYSALSTTEIDDAGSLPFGLQIVTDKEKEKLRHSKQFNVCGLPLAMPSRQTIIAWVTMSLAVLSGASIGKTVAC